MSPLSVSCAFIQKMFRKSITGPSPSSPCPSLLFLDVIMSTLLSSKHFRAKLSSLPFPPSYLWVIARRTEDSETGSKDADNEGIVGEGGSKREAVNLLAHEQSFRRLPATPTPPYLLPPPYSVAVFLKSSNFAPDSPPLYTSLGLTASTPESV